MARRAASSRRRGATPAMEPRIRDEIGAIALLAFALLSTVALARDQGAVLQWWRSGLFALLGWAAWLVPLALGAIALELWCGFVRRETVLPILGGTVIVVALLGLTRHYVRDDVAGGYVGGAVAKAAAALFGQIGAPVALGAILLAGIVIAANRTIADLLRPVWRQRQAIAALRPGTMIPGGTATHFDRMIDEDENEPRQQLRINLPEQKPARAAIAPAPPPPTDTAQPPKPVAGQQPQSLLAPSIAGLPSAAVAAEGVLHADPPDTPWVLPSIDLLAEGSAARTGEKEVVRNTRVIEETLANFDISAAVV